VPLDAAPEAYRVTIYEADEIRRTIETAAPATVYAAPDQLADFGAAAPGFAFEVAQLSAELGPGAAARGTCDG
jgi:hypothetical protein